MHQQERDRLIALAREDLPRGNTEKAKAKLKSVLRESPHCQPALQLLGEIYFRHRDYRNAVMYWSQADWWDNDMHRAARHVFRAAGRALMQEKAESIRYYLAAFAGSYPPDDLRNQLAALEKAYYKLARKQAKLLGLQCAPLVGGCLLATLGAAAVLTGGGLAWFTWIAGVAVIATLVVLAARAFSYLRASKGYRDTATAVRRSIGC